MILLLLSLDSIRANPLSHPGHKVLARQETTQSTDPQVAADVLTAALATSSAATTDSPAQTTAANTNDAVPAAQPASVVTSITSGCSLYTWAPTTFAQTVFGPVTDTNNLDPSTTYHTLPEQTGCTCSDGWQRGLVTSTDPYGKNVVYASSMRQTTTLGVWLTAAIVDRYCGSETTAVATAVPTGTVGDPKNVSIRDL